MFETLALSQNGWILHCLCSLGCRRGTSGSLEEGLFFRGSGCESDYAYLVEFCQDLVPVGLHVEVPGDIVGSPCVDSTIQTHYSQLRPFAVVAGVSLPLDVLDLVVRLGELDERLWFGEDWSVSLGFPEASPLLPPSMHLSQNLASKAMGNC